MTLRFLPWSLFAAIGFMLVTCDLTAQPRERPAAPPLPEEQVTKLREIIHTTQRTTQRLQNRLNECQKELSNVYAEYKLDDSRAGKLKAEIIELQTKLLDNHHKMQTDLREIVGEERFQTLSKRIKNILDSPKKSR